MREIKFRAWDKAFRKMFKVISVGYEGKETLAWRFPFEDERVGWSSAGWEVGKECDLMQYTGLKDKNGVEIYEGDIFSFYHEENNEDSKETSVVTWFGDGEWEYPAFDLNGAKLKKHRFEGNALHEIITSGFYEYEVIGNIYENPELIK